MILFLGKGDYPNTRFSLLLLIRIVVFVLIIFKDFDIIVDGKKRSKTSG